MCGGGGGVCVCVCVGLCTDHQQCFKAQIADICMCVRVLVLFIPSCGQKV